MSSDLLFYVDIIIPVGQRMLPFYLLNSSLNCKQCRKDHTLRPKKRCLLMTGISFAFPSRTEDHQTYLFQGRTPNWLRMDSLKKIRLTSDMTQDDIYDEIWSVFHGPMDGSNTFLFDVLQPAGCHSKSHTIPALSDSFKWTASTIVSKMPKFLSIFLLRSPSIR